TIDSLRRDMGQNYKLLLLTVLILLLAIPLCAQDTQYEPQGEQIPGPSNLTEANGPCCAKGGEAPISSEAWEKWLQDARHWKMEHLIRIGYSGAQYDRPELKWTQQSFIQPQMMAQDRYFYDPAAGNYTVDRYLDDLNQRYGGIDSVLIWPTYPNIGIDNRNQFDLIRDMPGGIAGLRAMVAEFHRRGVRVLFPYNPWDLGTRPEGATDWQTLAHLMAAIGADGFNGDTMAAVPLAFRTASDATGHPIVFEPEGGDGGNSDPAIAWNNMGWGYWKYPFEPMISKNKWLESRYMVNVCDRWARDRVNDLQYAFFNGTGYESWENIWGIWNQLDPRDAEALRRISRIERTFWETLESPDWEPFYPTLRYGAFSSQWPGNGQTLWTIVNRNEFTLAGPEIEAPYKPGLHYYDLWHGSELKPVVDGSKATLSFSLSAQGYGAVLAASNLSSEEQQLLAEMRQLAEKPLSGYSNQWHVLPQRMVPIAPTQPAASAPPGMVYVPGGSFLFRVSGVEIEGGNMTGLDVQYPWEDSPRREHAHPVQVKPFYIDKYPVTNAEFKKFMDATSYHPEDGHNFLRDWKNGSYPEGWANKPVTWVSLEDARAYAHWAGKRLPHEWEWQYAAQGTDGRLYPWGNQWDPAAVPFPDKGRALTGPADVNAHPKGASPFGVMDMTGNVWQWTDEFEDPHTRSAILRGGSYYQPQGSRWYFPNAYRLDEHGKYLLMAPSIDRAGTLGFRCVRDAQ
ncbi:MAG: formylglycine-generating enzyme family protein, partial [Terriglobia bacterium]